MKTVSEFLLNYAGVIIIVELAIMIAITITFQIKSVRAARELNGTMNYITEKIKRYFQTILLEEDESEKVSVPASKQETDMRLSLEKKKKKQEEAIIDAVLQEIFP